MQKCLSQHNTFLYRFNESYQLAMNAYWLQFKAIHFVVAQPRQPSTLIECSTEENLTRQQKFAKCKRIVLYKGKRQIEDFITFSCLNVLLRVKAYYIAKEGQVKFCIRIIFYIGIGICTTIFRNTHIVKHVDHRKEFAQQFLGTSMKLNVLCVETGSCASETIAQNKVCST